MAKIQSFKEYRKMANKKFDFIIYVEFANPYARIIRYADGKVWDVAADELAYGTTWTDTDIPLTLDAVIGGLPVTMPANLPGGDFDFIVYNASSPATGDDPQIGKRIQWTGKQILGVPIDL